MTWEIYFYLVVAALVLMFLVCCYVMYQWYDTIRTLNEAVAVLTEIGKVVNHGICGELARIKAINDIRKLLSDGSNLSSRKSDSSKLRSREGVKNGL